MSDLLTTNELTKRFGGIAAVDRCSINVSEGTITGLIGPNGSGKTTLFNLVTNLIRPDSGEVFFAEQNITNIKTYQITRHGIGRTFQVVRLFRNLTVLENLAVAGIPIKATWRTKADELLNFVNLYHLRNELAQNLSFGQQKLIEFCLALMQDPKLVLLDEPVAGVHPNMQTNMKEFIFKMKERGITFLVIEHNMPFLTSISDIVIAMSQGRVIAKGKPDEIRADRRVIDAYLGEA